MLAAFNRSVRANLQASDLRAFHVQRFIDSQERGKSPTTAGDYITLLKGIMPWAKGMGYIDRNAPRCLLRRGMFLTFQLCRNIICPALIIGQQDKRSLTLTFAP